VRIKMLIILVAFSSFIACAPELDVVIRGATLFDGTGSPGVVGDLAIKGDRIVAVGDVSGRGVLEIDAEGLYVAPGFTDMHSHSEIPRLLNGGRGPSMAYQGFTTEVYGETESMGPLGGKREDHLPEALEGKWTTFGEFLDFMESQGTSANFLS
jgi:N-acyl-D-amino-acid deacylase